MVCQLCLQADPAAVLGGQTLTDALGPVDSATLFAGVADVTPSIATGNAAHAAASALAAAQHGLRDGDDTEQAERRIIQVRR